MDVTQSKSKIFANKWINGESVNYTFFFTICVMLFFILKQILSIGFHVAAGISVGISFGISAVILYFFEKCFVFNHNSCTSALIQVLAYIFRTLVDAAFFFICRFFLCTFLQLESFTPFFVTPFILYFFNYYFDRLIIFNCNGKAIDNKNGRLYKAFFANRFVILSGCIAAVCFLFIYLIFKLFPFSSTTVMRMDLYHQYGPLFSELYDRVVQHKSFLYSWESGGGSSFLGNYFNYLSSPLSFIILLFNRIHIDYAITVMVMVKGVLSACTFSYYIKKSLKSHSYASAAFGVLYAFCGYFLAYYWNIMWIDGMILLPLVTLGIEEIVRYGKTGKYIAFLTLLLYSNYYMGYMICIFSVLYFFVYFVVSDVPGHINQIADKKVSIIKKLKNITIINRGFTFGVASLMCGILCACTLIPVFSLLQGSSATSGSFPTTFESYFDLIDLLKSHIAALETTIRSSGDDVLPNVYCGILTVLLVPLYFMNREIKLKEKAVYLLLLILFVFSFDNNMLNYVWHAMHFPNDLPYRFSFIYSFILLVIAYKGLKHIKALRYQDIVAVGMMWMLILLLFQNDPTNKMREYSTYINLAFIMVWTGVLLLIQKKKLSKFVLGVTMAAITFSEVIVADSNSFVFDVVHDSYTVNYTKYRECTNYLRAHDDDFYRSELCYLDTRMDPCNYEYNGMSVFSSMAYEKYSRSQNSLGMMSNKINSYTYNTQTPVYNMMYAIKYLTWTGDSIVPSDDYYEKIFTSSDGTAEIYRNKYTLPIAFLTSNEIKDWNNEEGNPFEVQEDLIDRAAGVSNVFIPCEYVKTECYETTCDDVGENGTYFASKADSESTTGTIDITIKSVNDGEMYVYVSSNDVKNINYYWDDNEETHYQNADEPYIMNLGKHKKGDTVTVSLDIGSMESSEGYFDIYAYNIDNDVFTSAYDLLNSCSLQVTNYGDTWIEGTINAGYDGYLYSSIPFDEGWNVYIDGKKQKIFEIGEAQLTTAIKRGKHTVRYEYTPRGLKIGIAVTTAGYTAVTVYAIIRKKRRKNSPQITIC